MYDLMSVIKETHVENKKISISPQTYVDYNFRIDYNSKNADCNPNAIELLILKGRNINIGTYSFYWNGTIQRIGNWSN